MVVAWIVAVWLLSLAVFVALRAHGTRNDRKVSRHRKAPGSAWTAGSVEVPAQRESSDSAARATERG